MPEPTKTQLVASAGAEDRQRVLNEVCRRVLRGFVGRKLTPTLMAEAEATVRAVLDDAVRAGSYVLPDGLALDRVELGADMRIKVLFKRTDVEPTDLSLTEILAGVVSSNRTRELAEKARNRFDAVALEIDEEELA